jgi:hypothetical protein
MTIAKCQIFLYDPGFAARDARPLAACRVPASRIAVPTPASPALLERERSPAGLARSRVCNIRHDSPRFFSCAASVPRNLKRGYRAARESRARYRYNAQ